MPRRSEKNLNGLNVETSVYRNKERDGMELPKGYVCGEVRFKSGWCDLTQVYLIETYSTFEAEGWLYQRAIVLYKRLERARAKAREREKREREEIRFLEKYQPDYFGQTVGRPGIEIKTGE